MTIRLKLKSDKAWLEVDNEISKARWRRPNQSSDYSEEIWGFACRWNDQQKYFETYQHGNWVKASEEHGMSPGGREAWLEVDELNHSLIKSDKILLGIDDDKT